MYQKNPLEFDIPLTKEIQHDEFYEKMRGVFGLKERNFWTRDSWSYLVNNLRKEALWGACFDTASHELQIEAILKSYFESKDPHIIHLAIKFAEILMRQETEGWERNSWEKREMFINYALRMGYMALLANAIDKRILHNDIQDTLDKFKEEHRKYQRNPLLEVCRFSFFKEELFDDPKNGNDKPKIKHDILNHSIKEISQDSKLFKKFEEMCRKTFPVKKKDDRKYFWPQRLVKRTDVDDEYFVEMSFGYNGGMPEVECDDDKNFDHKWIHYVKQIALFMETMYSNRFAFPRLVWLEDPDHSDVYSCYIRFSMKKPKDNH